MDNDINVKKIETGTDSRLTNSHSIDKIPNTWANSLWSMDKDKINNRTESWERERVQSKEKWE